MLKLHQVLAIEKGVKSRTYATLVSSAFVAALLRKLCDRRVNIQRIDITPRCK